jgi:signal transduction histidine kinase
LELELIWQPLVDTRVFVTVDRYKMSQVIRNIISNALKFSQAGQKVTVSAKIIEAHSYNQNIRSHFHLSRPKLNQSRAASTGQIHPEGKANDHEQSEAFDIENQQKEHSKLSLGTIFRRLIYHKHRSSNIYHEQSSNRTSVLSSNSITINNIDCDFIRIIVKDSGPGISKVDKFHFIFYLLKHLKFFPIGKSKAIIP